MRCRCPLYPQKRTLRLLHGMPIKSEQPPATITNLFPLLRNALNLRRPFQTPGVQTCAGGLYGAGRCKRQGAISSPLVNAAANAKMLVTPRAGMQSGEWWRTSPCACVGRRRLHPYRPKKRARPAPLPVTIPSGVNAARRARAPPLGVIPLDLHLEPCAAICYAARPAPSKEPL